jgi:hypothetical protein
MSQNFNILAAKVRAQIETARLQENKEQKDAFFTADKEWKDPEIYSQWLKINGEPEFTSEELAVSSDVNVLLENRRLILEQKMVAAKAAIAVAKEAMDKASAAPYEAAAKAGDPMIYNLDNFEELCNAESTTVTTFFDAREVESYLKRALTKHTYLLPPH